MLNVKKKFCDNLRWKSVHQNPILHETWSLSCIVRNLNITACEAKLYFKTSKDNLKIWSIVPIDDNIYSSVLFFFWLWNAM